MEAASTSETAVNIYQTTQRYNPEDSHFHTHHCENLKSYLILHLIPLNTVHYLQHNAVHSLYTFGYDTCIQITSVVFVVHTVLLLPSCDIL
jgi:hypothetical protein